MIVAAVAVLGVLGAAVVLNGTNNDDHYSIEYVLDGGEFDGDYPKTFKQGDELSIPSPVKGDNIFAGWYLDKGLETLFTGDTSELDHDITLYASWSDDLSGHTITLTKSGNYNRGFNSYTLSGDLTFTYLYYSEEKGSYYIRNTDNTTYTYTYTHQSYSESTSSMYWSSEIEGDWEDLGTQTITTLVGEKECNVQRLTYPSGATETQWIGDEWIPYQIQYHFKYGHFFEQYEVTINYTYLKDGFVEIESDCDVTVIEGYGVDVTGNTSPYKLGEQATLTATVSGVEFAGWYDDNFNLLSSDLTYKFVIGGSQTVYALNKKEIDIEFRSDELIDLDKEFGLSSGKYTITNSDTDLVSTAESTFEFTDGGSYTIVAEDSNGEHRFFRVKVTGYAARSFEWKYDGKTYNFELEIDYDDLLYTRGYYTESQRQQQSGTHARDKTFVTLSYTDEKMAPYMEELVDEVLKALNNDRISEYDLLDYLLAFTQYIEYQTDEEYMGVTEYWKFPLETLYDQGGDCEDTSILFAAMAHECRDRMGMTYKVALQLLPGHMAGAVDIGSTSYSKNPSGYIYAETTTVGYDLGVIPDTMKSYFTLAKYYSQGSSYTVEID